MFDLRRAKNRFAKERQQEMSGQNLLLANKEDVCVGKTVNRLAWDGQCVGQ